MDSDAGMYTLTRCVSDNNSPVEVPSNHYIPPPSTLPMNWSTGEEIQYTTLGAPTTNHSRHDTTVAPIHGMDNYEHLHHQHHASMYAEHEGEDPYIGGYSTHMHQYQQGLRAGGVYSYDSMHGDDRLSDNDEKVSDYKNNNNNIAYEYENGGQQHHKKNKSRKSSQNQGAPVTRNKAGKAKSLTSPGKSSSGISGGVASPKKLESSEDENNTGQNGGNSDLSNVSNYDNVMVWLNHQACGGTVKRKRRITKTQRVAANQRERKRMVHLNTAFECLRQTIPSFPYEKKLSRIQTLKLAIDYIAFMTEILYGKNSGVSSSHSGYPPYSGSESPDINSDLHYW